MLPVLAIAETLLKRGHRVAVVVDAIHAASAAASLPGVEVHALGSAEATAAIVADVELRWNRPWVVVCVAAPEAASLEASKPDFCAPPLAPHSHQWLAQLPQHVALLRSLHRRDPGAVFAGTPLDLAVRLLEEVAGAACCTLLLQPWMVRSLADPPQFAGMAVHRRAPRLLKRLAFWLQDLLADAAFCPQLNAERARLGLPPARRVYHAFFQCKRALGLWPPAYSPLPPDAPAGLRLVGFPMADTALAGQPRGLPPDVEALLRGAEAAQPPAPIVAVALGSAPTPGAAAVECAAVAACARIGARCVVLSRSLPPSPCQPHACWAAYAPFADLLPRVSAFVTNGGVGGAAHALAASCPCVVVPGRFDQPDNAHRLRRLGVAVLLPEHRCTPAALAGALLRLRSDRVRAACAAASQALSMCDHRAALDRAADALEELGGQDAVALSS